MWPSFRSAWRRRLNHTLLSRFLKQHVPDHSDSVVLTTVPIVADLVGTLPVRRWVYYRVDDFAAWPGIDSNTVCQMEASLVAGADRVVAAGEELAEPMRQQGRDPVVITHGVDLEHWSTNGKNRVVHNFDCFQRPIALFWGLVDRRLDLTFLEHLGRSMQRGSIVLIGPEQEPDPGLARIPRVYRAGPLPFEDLPGVASQADVLIMPYADLPVTRAMQPLKLKEYLATGKPVVARDLPAVQRWRDALDVVADPHEFVGRVLDRFDGQIPPSQRRARVRLGSESWAAKARQLEEVLFGP